MQRAVEIASNLTSNEYVAVTLAGGYAVRPDGSRYLFEPCRVREMKRNDQGRCTKLVGTYYDGSTQRIVELSIGGRIAGLMPAANILITRTDLNNKLI
jgi:hypothetical protein